MTAETRPLSTRWPTLGAVGTLAHLPTDEVIDRILGGGIAGLNDVRQEMTAAADAAWAATDSRLLEMCRIRVAMLLGCPAEVTAQTPGVDLHAELLAGIAQWPSDPRFGEVERACLAFTEHFVIDVASLDDETAGAVHAHLGDAGLVNFVQALLVVEQRIRLRLIWDRLLGGN